MAFVFLLFNKRSLIKKMNNLILVRHGQSFWNKERRFTGWADIDLTEKGKLEAENAGKLIKSLNSSLNCPM